MRRLYEFIKRSTTFFIATVDANGDPQVRPFAACILRENQLYFFTHEGKPVYEQMVAHPRVAICSYDQQAREWLRMEGNVVFDEDPALACAMMEAAPEHVRKKREMSQAERENQPEAKVQPGVFTPSKHRIFHLADMTARFCSFTQTPQMLHFD